MNTRITDSAFTGQFCWIIGASSGIGHALATELASQGAILALSARREEPLQELAQSLPGQGHLALPLDVADPKALEEAIQYLQKTWPKIDRVIFMAATFNPTPEQPLSNQETSEMISINLTSAFYLANLLLSIFKNQQSGQFAICASTAGYHGLPSGQPYCATKAGLISLAESLHAEWPDFLSVKVINPGFVKTRITDKNQFSMPFIIEPEKAARHIAKGLNARAFEIHFPKAFSYPAKLMRLLPYWITLRITRKMAKKVGY